MIPDSELRRKEYQKRHREKLKQERPWMICYYNAYGRCKNKASRYFERGIKCLLTPIDVERLWGRYKAYLMKKPSIDRIDGNKNYTVENCRFLELEEHRKLPVPTRKPPKGWGTFANRKIKQFDLSGNYIRAWPSIRSASKTLKISYDSVWKCAKGIYKHCGGYKWTYA